MTPNSSTDRNHSSGAAGRLSYDEMVAKLQKVADEQGETTRDVLGALRIRAILDEIEGRPEPESS